jgi:hypothetical protein
MRSSVVVAVLVCARVAAADPTPAEAAFDRGRELLKQGKLDDACAAFHDSLELDFQYGTLYNLAGCEEKRGKLVAAWKAYRRLQSEDKNQGRSTHAGELAAQLEKRLPKLSIDLAPVPAGVTISIDNERAELGAPIPVEAGSHAIAVAAPGYHPWRITVTATEGVVTKVQPALVVDTAPAPPTPPASPPPKLDRRLVRDHPILGPTLTISGGASIALAIGLGLHAHSVYADNLSAARMGNQAALARTNDAITYGNVATVFTVAGLLVLPVGGFLWHQGMWVVTPQAEAHGGSVAVSGRF